MSAGNVAWDTSDVRSTPGPAPRSRREPVQERSRRRVEAVLDAAERLVVAEGVEQVTTSGIARESGVPVGSLYQYFADKEAVLLALAERHMAEMDEQTAADLAAVPAADLTVGVLVETSVRAFTTVYERRPAFVAIYLRGRVNPRLAASAREHNRRIAASLRDVAIDAGLAGPDLSLRVAELAVEVGDRVVQLAYEDDLAGDAETIAEGVHLMTAYLERYAATSTPDQEPAPS